VPKVQFTKDIEGDSQCSHLRRGIMSKIKYNHPGFVIEDISIHENCTEITLHGKNVDC
jgi:hypothetical protein